MDILLRANNGYEIIVKTDNVNISEDVEEREYGKAEDGKVDFKNLLYRDISSDFVKQITILLDDIIYYRKREFDSCDLIERLFEKLPANSLQGLLNTLNKKYQ